MVDVKQAVKSAETASCSATRICAELQPSPHRRRRGLTSRRDTEPQREAAAPPPRLFIFKPSRSCAGGLVARSSTVSDARYLCLRLMLILQREELTVKKEFTAVIQQRDGWWIGWIEEVPGVNSQGETREELLENLRSALSEALEMNRSDAIAAAAEEPFEEVSIAA